MFSRKNPRTGSSFVTTLVLLSLVGGCGKTVGGGSQPPQVNNDSYVALDGRFLYVGTQQGVLANDRSVSTVEGGTIFTVAGGLMYLNDDGSFSYYPPPGFAGMDAFNYTASNGWVGTVTFQVFHASGTEEPESLLNGDPFDTLSCCWMP